MSQSPDRSTPRVRRSAKRRSREAAAPGRGARGRTLLTLGFDTAFNIQGAGVAVSQAAIDATGNTYIAGQYTGTATFGKTAGGSTVMKNSTGSTEAFVAAYSPTGVVLWVAQFVPSDSGSLSTASSLAFDAHTSTVYVVGTFKGTVNFDPNGSGVPVTSSSDSSSGSPATDAYIVALSTADGTESNRLFDDFVQTESNDTSLVTARW